MVFLVTLTKLKTNLIFLESYSKFFLIGSNLTKRTVYFSCLAKPRLINSLSKLCSLNFSIARPSTTNDENGLESQTENDVVHSFMQNSPAYRNFISSNPSANTKSDDSKSVLSTRSNACLDFITFTVSKTGTSISIMKDEKLLRLASEVTDALPHQTDTMIFDILNMLRYWPRSTKYAVNSVTKLKDALDQECCLRMKNWPVPLQLKAADLWFTLSLNRTLKFSKLLMDHLSNNLKCLENQEFIYFLFLLNVMRKADGALMLNVEKELSTRINLLTIYEIGIAAMAFFKTNSDMKNANLIDQMLQITISNLSTIDSYTFSSLLKHFRKSCQPAYHKGRLQQLLTEGSKHVSRFNRTTMVHLSTVNSTIPVYNPQALDKISAALINEMDNLRIKDIMKFMFSLIFFGHNQQNDFFDQAIKQFRQENRKKEIEEHPFSLMSLVCYLSYKHIFPEDLINWVFSENFISKLKMKEPAKVLRELAFIDFCLEIDKPSHKGIRLEPDLRKRIIEQDIEQRFKRNRIETLSYNDMLKLDIMKKLRKVMQDAQYCMRTILPHMADKDILVILEDDKRTFKEIPNEIRMLPQDEVLNPSKEGIWVVFVLLGRKSYCTGNSKLMGKDCLKLSQLETLGYKIVTVPYLHYLSQSEDNKTQFLINLLNKALIK